MHAKNIPDADNDIAVEFVVALGIMDVSENGNFEGTKNVTRAEFSKMAYRLFNLNTLMNENHFRDVYEDTPEVNEINVLHEMGIINGVGDNRFAPDREISVNESIKIILDMMGYKNYCIAKGGYPAGYLSTASQIRLTNDFSVGADRNGIARILYNAALCEVPNINKISADGNFNLSTDGTTLLERYHDIYLTKGIVTANHLFAVDGKETTGFGKIRINGIQLELGADRYRLYDAVGYYSEIFYRYDEEADKKTVVFGTKDEEKSNEEVIFTEDIENYSSYTIYLENDDKFTFSSSAIVLKNNTLLQSYTKDDFTSAYGKIVYTSYGGYNVLRIIDWDIYVVNFVSYDERTVYNKYSPQKNFVLNEGDASITYSLHDAYGQIEDFESIRPGDVLCVAEGNGFSDITRITEKKTHIITSSDEDKFYYDGGYFELGSNLKNAIKSGLELAPQIGESMQVVYDLYGRAAGFSERSNDGEMLVYLVNALYKSNLSELYKFQFLTDKGAKLAVEANDKVEYAVGDISSVISAEQFYKKLFDENKDIIRQVAYIKINADNKLIYFEGATDDENRVDGKLSKKSVSGNYKKEPMSIDGKASGDAQTVVFAYPVSDSERSNIDLYNVFSLSNLNNNDSFSATVYERDIDKIPVVAMAVMQNNVSTKPASLFIVDEIIKVYDKDEGEVFEIKGFENGAASTIRVLDESVIKNPVLTTGDANTFELSGGDVIRYSRGADNYITEITVKYDYETSGVTPWAGGIYNKFTNLFHMVGGTAELVDGKYVKINLGTTDGTDNGFEIAYAGSVKITVVIPSGKGLKIRAGTVEDIIDARSGNPSFIITRSSSGSCNEIIVYR